MLYKLVENQNVPLIDFKANTIKNDGHFVPIKFNDRLFEVMNNLSQTKEIPLEIFYIPCTFLLS